MILDWLIRSTVSHGAVSKLETGAHHTNQQCMDLTLQLPDVWSDPPPPYIYVFPPPFCAYLHSTQKQSLGHFQDGILSLRRRTLTPVHDVAATKHALVCVHCALWHQHVLHNETKKGNKLDLFFQEPFSTLVCVSVTVSVEYRQKYNPRPHNISILAAFLCLPQYSHGQFPSLS